MYSNEDRSQAVQLYIKLGKRAGLTIRQLGYPTKNTLKDWYLAYEQSCDFPRAYTRAPKYSPQQRQQAVDYFLSHGRSVPLTIKVLGHPSRRYWAIGFNRLIPNCVHGSDRLTSHSPFRRSTQPLWRFACARDLPSQWPRIWACPDLPCTSGRINCSTTRRWNP